MSNRLLTLTLVLAILCGTACVLCVIISMVLSRRKNATKKPTGSGWAAVVLGDDDETISDVGSEMSHVDEKTSCRNGSGRARTTIKAQYVWDGYEGVTFVGPSWEGKARIDVAEVTTPCPIGMELRRESG
mmetsp:Transcript_47034/g.100405  ORF Transcript_47034/g.100405 Transcript_47034/m.100405 type:complete len:130 (-) Transcript_47034:29-418(-)